MTSSGIVTLLCGFVVYAISDRVVGGAAVAGVAVFIAAARALNWSMWIVFGAGAVLGLLGWVFTSHATLLLIQEVGKAVGYAAATGILFAAIFEIARVR